MLSVEKAQLLIAAISSSLYETSFNGESVLKASPSAVSPSVVRKGDPMDKDQVLARLCKLVSNVGSEVFHSHHSHDCFCGATRLDVPNPKVDEKIIHFIEQVVHHAIREEKWVQSCMEKSSRA